MFGTSKAATLMGVEGCTGPAVELRRHAETFVFQHGARTVRYDATGVGLAVGEMLQMPSRVLSQGVVAGDRVFRSTMIDHLAEMQKRGSLDVSKFPKLNKVAVDDWSTDSPWPAIALAISGFLILEAPTYAVPRQRV